MPKPFLGLRTCIYKVTDLQNAIEWYSKVFKTKPYFNEPFYVGFNIGGYELGLQQEEIANKTANVFTYWGVENVQQEYDRILALGATEHEKPNNVGGEIEVASLFDPWGNILGLIYNPDFKLID